MTAGEDMLESVSPRKAKLRELLIWLKNEKGLSLRQLAERSGGAFGHNTLSALLKQERPNPELDTIHGLSKAGGITEQMVMDACLGRPFRPGDEFSEEAVKELFRQYEALKPENRTDVLEFTLNTLKTLLAEAVEMQERQNRPRR